MPRSRQLRLPLLLVCAAVLMGGCSRPAATVPTERLTGTYVREHVVWTFHGSEPIEGQATDRVTFVANGPDSLTYRLEVVSLTGTRCTVVGSATAGGDGFEVSHGGSPCTMTPEGGGSRLRLDGEDLECLAGSCEDLGETADGGFLAELPAE